MSATSPKHMSFKIQFWLFWPLVALSSIVYCLPVILLTACGIPICFGGIGGGCNATVQGGTGTTVGGPLSLQTSVSFFVVGFTYGIYAQGGYPVYTFSSSSTINNSSVGSFNPQTSNFSSTYSAPSILNTVTLTITDSSNPPQTANQTFKVCYTDAGC